MSIAIMKNTFSLRFLAWVIWSLSAFFMFYKYALEVSPSIMTSTLMSYFQIDGTSLGNLAASYFYAYLFMQIPAGVLLDRYGPRKMTSCAIAIAAVGCIIFAASNSFSMALLGRFMTGFGAAFAAVNCLKLTANWFPPRKFAFMTGLMMTIGMLGAVGGQAPLSMLINAVQWKNAMKLIGYVGLALALVFVIIVRDRTPHTKEKYLGSPKMGLFQKIKKLLVNPQSWFISLYSGFAFSPVMIFGGLWGVPFIEETYGFSKNVASQSVSLIFIGFAVGAPIFGWFSDWIKRRKVVMFWGTLGSLIVISLIVYFPGVSHIMLMALLLLFGFFISSFLLCFTVIREINAPAIAATAIGFMNSFDALFGSFSDPLTGKFLDLGWTGKIVDGARIYSVDNYQMAFLILPSYLLISLITLFFVKETFTKETAPSSLP